MKFTQVSVAASPVPDSTPDVVVTAVDELGRIWIWRTGMYKAYWRCLGNADDAKENEERGHRPMTGLR